MVLNKITLKQKKEIDKKLKQWVREHLDPTTCAEILQDDWRLEFDQDDDTYDEICDYVEDFIRRLLKNI